LVNWWHHVTNPHCAICSDEQHEQRQCKNCDTLRGLLESEKFEKKELLNYLLVPKTEARISEPITQQPVMPRSVPWKVRAQMLEAEDRKTAQIMRDKQNEMAATTEDLEKELLG